MTPRVSCIVSTIVALVWTSSAAAEPLAVHPDREPRLLGAAPELGTGVVRLEFTTTSGVFEVPALPAAVIAIRAGAPIPPELEAEGTPLGRARRSWRVPAGPGENGLDVALRWAGHPSVESVVPDLLLQHERRVTFDDPKYASQWYLERLGMPALFDVTIGRPEVRVAVIDSAIEISHPDLAAGVDDPYDAFDDDTDPSPNPGEYCYDGSEDICDEHGTAVSGIIGARSNNGEGIVGLCSECTLIPIKMLGEGMGATSADVAAFEHAIDSGAWVINNSWGFTTHIPVPAPLKAVIERAATEPRDGKGAVVVFAAGNDDRELGMDEMEALDSVLCISATDIYGNPTAYTNYGEPVDVSAPSATYTTSHSAGYTETFGGTSAAAPVVSGVAGWILSAAPELTATEVRTLIVDTAVPSPKVTPDENGFHPMFGYGELNPTNILAELFPAEDTDAGDTDEEKANACACDSGATSSAGLVFGAIATLAARRRRAGGR
jgi:serine protease